MNRSELPSRSSWVLVALTLGAAVPFLLVRSFSSQLYLVLDVSGYLTFHNAVEFFSVMVSLSIFGVGWFSYEQRKDRHALFLSVAFLGIGLMDFMHTLGYPGMPPLVTPNSPNKSTQYWVAVRFFAAACFLASGFIKKEERSPLLDRLPLMLGVLAITALTFVSITFYPGLLPDTFLEGVGLTPFKKLSEVVIIALLLLAILVYLKRLRASGDQIYLHYLCAFILCIVSELSFTLYKSAYDSYNALGHLYKVFAFVLIYRGIFAIAVKRPYRELHRALEELRHTNDVLLHIMDSIPHSIFWKDRDTVYLGCNREFARSAELADPAQIVGKCDYDLPWSREESDGYRADDQEVMQKNRAKMHIIEKLTRADGSVLWIDTSKIPLTDEDGAVRGVLGIYEDISKRRAIEEQLRQAQKLESVGRLAGGVAHDFNNKLTVILGNAELALLRSTDQVLLDQLGQIVKAAEQSRDITSQLLAFSRQQVVTPKTVQVNAMLQELKKSLGRLIGEHISIVLSPGEELWNISIDPVQLDQIIMNLAVNARDAMPRGGTITIETSNVELAQAPPQHPEVRPGRYVRITCRDTGVGIDEETRAHIFEPFYTTKPQGAGTGLGLATVYGIVRQNGGFIDLESAPGQGSMFSVNFPGCTEEQGGEQQRDAAARPVRGSGTVMLVEDEDMVRDLTAAMLEALGYRCLAICDPREAVEVASNPEVPIDLVLTDVQMPGLRGQEMIAKMRQQRPGLKCIYMSGFTAAIVDEGIASREGAAFLKKPFQLEELAQLLRSMLAR